MILPATPDRALAAPRSRWHRASRALTATVAVCAVAASAVAVPSAAVAATNSAPQEDPVSFVASPRSDGVVQADDTVTISARGFNPTSSPVEEGTVTVSVADVPLTTEQAITAWVNDGDGMGADAGFSELESANISALAAGGAATSSLSIDIGESVLADRTPGVYPLRTEWQAGELSLASESVIVLTDGEGEAAIGVIVPLTAPALESAVLTSDQLAALTGPEGELRDLLDAVTGTDAILAVDPAIVAAIRLLGTRAPESATAWLDDLEGLSNSRFALQFGDADVAAAAQSETPEILRIPELASLRDPQGFTAPATPDTNEGAGTDGAVSTLPTNDELLDVGASRERVYWPVSSRAGAAAVTAISATNEGDGDALTIVPSSAASTPVTGARATTSTGEQLIVADAAASRALTSATTTDTDIARARELATANALLSIAGDTADGAPLAVIIDRPTGADGDDVRAAINATTTLPGAVNVSLDDLARAEPTTVALAESEVDALRVDAIAQFREGEEQLARVATMLADPLLLTAAERAQVLQLLGAGWQSTPGAWQDARDRHFAQTAQMQDAVAIMPPSGITLLGSSAPLQFAIRNDLPWPVTVELEASPSDPRLIVQSSTTVEAGAGQTTRAGVPVRARVGSGDSTIELQLRGPTGIAIGSPAEAEVSVRAEWETAGIVVMSVVIGGLLLMGAVRTFLRIRRRDRDAVGATASEGEDRQ